MCVYISKMNAKKEEKENMGKKTHEKIVEEIVYIHRHN